jgi:uncharacterized membrane protein
MLEALPHGATNWRSHYQMHGGHLGFWITRMMELLFHLATWMTVLLPEEARRHHQQSEVTSLTYHRIICQLLQVVL